MRPEDITGLVDQYGAEVYRLCLKLSYNKGEAEDLYQETFLKAVECSHKLDKNKNPKGFLASICIFIWKSNKRKYARRNRIAPSLQLDESLETPDHYSLENHIIHKDIHRIIQEVAAQMDDKFKIPLYLHYTMEFSVEETGAALGIASGTVKSRLYKARKIIKKRLEAVGYETE